MKKTTLVGIDCGSAESGIVVITSETGIREGINVSNAEIMEFVKKEAEMCDQLLIVIEDVRPYNMRITDGIIKTIKVIGQIEWRLKEAGMAFTLIPRWEVKQWVFLQFRTIIEPEIIKKIQYSNARKEKMGEKINIHKQSPTFVYVDDRLVQKAMRKHWNIPKQSRVGEKAPFNLKDHSWQALGLASYYIVLHRPPAFLR